MALCRSWERTGAAIVWVKELVIWRGRSWDPHFEQRSAARADMSNALDDGELVDCISFFPLVVRGAG